MTAEYNRGRQSDATNWNTSELAAALRQLKIRREHGPNPPAESPEAEAEWIVEYLRTYADHGGCRCLCNGSRPTA